MTGKITEEHYMNLSYRRKKLFCLFEYRIVKKKKERKKEPRIVGFVKNKSYPDG